VIDGEPLFAGTAEGMAMILDAPLSFWGGIDPSTGRIVDVRHPQHGQSVTDRILIMPTGRGSSSSSTILAEATRLRTAPAAIIVAVADPVLVVGAIVADRLYGIRVPIIRADVAGHIADGEHVRVHSDGRVVLVC
jgi:hypothetical protein